MDQFTAFQALLHRGYWNGIWVIQEVNAAKEAEVICGQDTIPWKDLLAAQNAIVSNRDACWKLVRDNPKMAKFASDVYYEGPRGLVIQCDGQTPTLFEALRWHCTKTSTQPEDRIYGLAGITTAGSDPRFILDYSRSIRQIYIDAAVYIIETTRNLDIICIMQVPAQQTLVPCWVPDWLNGTPSGLLDSSIDIFDASMNRDAIASCTSDGNILVAKGFCIGSIVSTGSALLINMENESESVFHLLSKFHEWRQLFSFRGASIDTVDLEAFCRTFTCARIVEELDLLAGLPQDHVLRIMLGIFAQLSRKSYTDRYLGSTLCTLADKAKHLATIDKLEAWARVILLDVGAIINRRRFIIANNKAIGMACQFAEVGDKICILLGCSTPVILRPMDKVYRFIGDSYVDGYMFGRGTLEAEAGEYRWEEFSLY